MDLEIYEPPRRALVVARPSLAKAVSGFFAKAAGPSRLEPRKGATDMGLAPLIRLQQNGKADRPSPKASSISYQTLRALAERDDIIWSIRRTIRMAIGDMPWKIVPDIDAVKADLKQWETKVLVNLAMPGLNLEFQPRAMSMEVYERASGVLKEKLVACIKSGDDPSRSPEIRGFFENIVAAHEAIALSHVEPVEALLRTPNRTQTSFRALLDLIIDDLTLFDAACIVKNPTYEGKLGEIYNLPGEEITVYRTLDRNIPMTPNVAYDWQVDSKVRAFYNKDEVTYLSLNPQNNGYGKSPLESLVEQMVGSIYGDAYLLDGFANNNMPYAVFDGGPNLSEGERKALERSWDNRTSGGQHRVLFMGNKEGVKGFMPLVQGEDKDDSTIDKMKYWANRKTAAYNLSLNDIGFTEDLHRTTSETQSELTQSRGINSVVKGLEHAINLGIIKGRMWVRSNPDDPNSLGGESVPCFPFGDVKLSFVEDSRGDKIERATRLTSLITGGVITVNEARKEEDLPPVAGGDTLVISGSTLMKIEDLPNLPSPADKGGGAPGGPPQPGQPPQGKPPEGEAPGAPGQDDGGAPPDPGQPKGGDVTKGLNEITRVARTLAKMADSHTHGG